MKTLLIGVLASLMMGVLAWAQTPSNDQTVQDLQAAFNGESNAAAKYQVFAQKADQEGFAQAGALFRAAARAEQIHAANHARVLKSMGAEAKADLQKPQIGTTQENLKVAIEGESAERDSMYPQFIQNARGVKNVEAVKTFTQARTAEAEHAKLYGAMLQNIDQPQKQATPYIVCPVCGYTAAAISGKCPSCFTPKEKFEVIS